MHGLINRALQRFAEDTFGMDVWAHAIGEAAPKLSGFEAMFVYEDDITHKVLAELSNKLSVSEETILEDLGTYLVSHPNTDALRRLLRFGGENFVTFLYSLDDLPDRICLAVSDLIVPPLDLLEHAPGRFTLIVGPGLSGIGHVLLGLLRAMADDYGALALVELMPEDDSGAKLSINVAETTFAKGKSFDLAVHEVAQ